MQTIDDILNTIQQMDAMEYALSLPPQSVNTVITSPPYWGLRSYLPGQVKIRGDLTEEDMAYVLSELERLGIDPIQGNQNER